MSIEERLSEAFHAKAQTSRTSPDAFTTIRDRVRRRHRVFALELAGAGLAVPAIITVAVVLSRSGGTPEPKPTRGPVASPTTPSTSASPSSAASYAEAIAVARPGGVLDVVSPSGTLLRRIATFKGGHIGQLEWSPDRTELYVSTTPTTRDDEGCTPPEAVAINVTTGASRQLGPWTDFAFSSDGSKLAAVEQRQCGSPTLLVRNLATGEQQRIAAATDEGADASYGSLSWVPGVDRVVLVQYGPGDSTDLLLVDLSTAASINEGTRLDVGDGGAGETVTAATYVGSRLIVALTCCVNTTERLRLVERIGATGDLRELLVLPEQSAYHLHASPDGTRVAYSEFADGWLRIWDFVSGPARVEDHVAAIAW
jgi:WD40 repeat protein